MGTTKIWDVKTRLDHVVDYATDSEKTGNPDFEEEQLQTLRDVMNYAANDFKTERQFYVSGINCDPEFARNQMLETKRFWSKTKGILAFHAYQSFSENEVTAEMAHRIGLELANRIWGERFEVLVATHLNTNHFHNHFVVNSVSFTDGKRYYDNNASYRLFRQTSDEVCREFGLSVIENPQTGKTKHYSEHQADSDGRITWRGNIREDIDRAIAGSATTRQFWDAMEKQGYELKMNVKYPAVRPPGHSRFFRLYRLGENYTAEAIKKRIIENKTWTPPLQEKRPTHRLYMLRNVHHPKKHRTGLQVLYLQYSYKLGILPKPRASNKRMHFLLRQDLIRLDSIIAQSRLLLVNNISTRPELLEYQESLKHQCDELVMERRVLRNQIKRSTDPETAETLKNQIATISKQLKEQRKGIRNCDEIITRSEGMIETLRLVSSDEKQKWKEDKKHEHIR